MSGKRYRGANVSRAKRERIIERWGGRCWICGSKPPADRLTLDHVKPHSLGGTTSEDNLRPACPSCNRRRGNDPISNPSRVVAVEED